MELKISDKAAEWFQDELNLGDGEYIRFFVRYGGTSPIQKGFSLGMNKETPFRPGVKHEKNGRIYFVEENDMWYFDGHDLYVDYDEQTEGPLYKYQ